MKVCGCCHIEKGDENFRLRQDKRREPVLVYLSNYCLQCESELNKERVRKERQTPEGREKHNRWALESYRRNREKVIVVSKKRRQTDSYKEKMREYRQKNKEKIYQQEVVTKRRYHEKNKDVITDVYVINLLKSQGIKEPTVAEIEIKRSKILIARIRKKINHTKIGKTKKCNRCGKEKDISMFWRKSKNSDERISYCSDCGKEMNKNKKRKI